MKSRDMRIEGRIVRVRSTEQSVGIANNIKELRGGIIMIAEKMKPFVQNNSAIRMMFEEGNRLRAKYGADKVYDFSLGNPSVPAPDCVREAIIDLVNNEEPTVLHGYMNNAGFEDVRETIAQSLNRRFGTAFSAHNLIMTVGAASGLNVILKTILNPGEEVIVFAPYFLEYGAYVRNYDGKLVEISPNTETFQPNLKELEEKINVNTRAVIVNTPHNPTGVVYSEETIKELAAILEKKQQEFGSVIKTKDYIKEPKKSGYQSLHLILEVAMPFQNESQWIKVELQLRTAAMDYWANLDHQLRYKRGQKQAAVINEELQRCASVISELDQKMLDIRKKIDRI